MKTILLPTDFSACSKHAINYALNLYKGEKCKFILLHVIDSSSKSMLISVGDILVTEASRKLDQKVNTLQKLFDREDFTFDSIVETGDLIMVIDKLVLKHQVDTIVIGTKGSNERDYSKDVSNTSRVIQQITCPVIAVPHYQFPFQLKKILFAINKKVSDVSLFDPIIELSKKFNSAVQILHVTRTNEMAGKSISKLGLNGKFDTIHHSFNFIENDDILEGIQQFIGEQHPDMIVMVAGKNSFFDAVYHKSFTTKLALHSHIPLFTIHDLKQP